MLLKLTENCHSMFKRLAVAYRKQKYTSLGPLLAFAGEICLELPQHSEVYNRQYADTSSDGPCPMGLSSIRRQIG